MLSEVKPQSMLYSLLRIQTRFSSLAENRVRFRDSVKGREGKGIGMGLKALIISDYKTVLPDN